MVECHGSQCGFCTPGIVMTLWSAYEHHQQQGSEPTRQQLADELSGNLCRCTAVPILDAGQRMFDLPAVRLDTAPVVAALQGLQAGNAGLNYAAPRACAPTSSTLRARWRIWPACARPSPRRASWQAPPMWGSGSTSSFATWAT
jgi:xanthine dehydrogenase iron-sulfur cluster and FAD-binding subunit A